jgi:hypothetical protein
MLSVALRLLELMSLQGKVADLPYHKALLVLVIALDTVIGIVAAHYLADGDYLARVLLGQIFTCASICGLLWLRSRAARAVQSLLALSGTGIVFGLLQLLIALVFALAGAPKEGPVALFVGLLILMLMLWNALVSAHIIKQAADMSLAEAMLVTIALMIANIGLWHWLAQGMLQ